MIFFYYIIYHQAEKLIQMLTRFICEYCEKKTLYKKHYFCLNKNFKDSKITAIEQLMNEIFNMP